MKRLFLMVLFLTLLPGAFAVIDLTSPDDNFFTSNTTVTFEYYASVPLLQGCTVFVGPQAFPDVDAQSDALNSVQVQNIVPDTYLWNVTCEANQTETSNSRTLTIDTTPPTVVIVSPEEGDVADTLSIDFIPNDDSSNELQCTVSWLGDELEEVTVTANTHYTETYSAQPGTGALDVLCADEAGNTFTESRTLTLEPQLFLSLTMDDTEYGIDEPALLTIDTLPGADVTVDVCPNEVGFVQCTTALLDTDEFPQTITLPYMNKTGEYLVDAIVQYNDDTQTAQILYSIVNTMQIDVDVDDVGLNQTITLTADVSGGIAPYAITWTLSNDTVRAGAESTEVVYEDSGEYNVTVQATDDAGNTVEHIETIVVEPEYDVTFAIIDNTSGVPVLGATVDFDGDEWTTLQDGLAPFTVQQGKRSVFITAPGYAYFIQEYFINNSQTITVPLQPTDDIPVISVRTPQSGAVVTAPVDIAFSVQHTQPVTCTLLKATDSDWFAENGTLSIADSNEHTFTRNYVEGEHTIRIECADAEGKAGSTPLITFTVGNEAEQPAEEIPDIVTDDEIYLQELKDSLDEYVEALEGYGPDEQLAIELLSFDKNLRNLRRAVQQAIRDIDSLQFREDLDAEGVASEQQAIMDRVDSNLQSTPLLIRVRDDKLYVKYVEEEHLEDVLEGLEGVEEFQPGKKFIDDQQQFTISSKILHVEYVYAGSSTETITVVQRSFTYAEELGDAFTIVEIVPKAVAKTVEEIELLTPAEVWKEDPVLSYALADEISYAIQDEVSFHKIEESHTFLARKASSSGNSITGFAILGAFDVPLLGWPIIVVILLVVAGWLAYRYSLFKQIKYIIYRFKKNEQVHYVRVLINDAEDQLDANAYEKAEMLYKEVRLTYDTLNELARNELYDDVMGLVGKMDSFYFNMVMIELDHNIKAGDMEAAIASYEKLVGTFERLSDDQQQELVQIVTTLAKRLGVGV